MEKEIKIRDYMERIKEELSYNDYANAKDLCVRASNIDSHNLCLKYLREFIEIHKKQNGRYEKLNILETCAYLYKSMEYITAENWENLSVYCDCLADELFEREREFKMHLKEEFDFVRNFKDSIIYIRKHVEMLSEIIEQQQIEGKSINRFLEAVENLRNRLEYRLEIVEKNDEKQRKTEEEENRKKERDRLISRWVVGIGIAIMAFVLLIATCTGKMTW